MFGVETRVWERVHDLGSGDPAICVRPKPLPRDQAPLSTSSQCAQPASRDLRAKGFQSRRVAWHSVVIEVPVYHAAKPFALLRDWLVTPERQFALHLGQLGSEPFGRSLPLHDEPFVSADLPTDVDESQEREGLRLAFPTLPSVLGGEPPEFDQSRLVGVQGQAELIEAFPQFAEEPLGLAREEKTRTAAVL